MERGDVLQRDQDVPVQLDVGDILDEAVRGEHAVLVVTAEERNLDLLALVLVGVILHPNRSLDAGKPPGGGPPVPTRVPPLSRQAPPMLRPCGSRLRPGG